VAAEEDTSCAWSYRRDGGSNLCAGEGDKTKKSKHCEVMDDKDKWCFHDLMRQRKYRFSGLICHTGLATGAMECRAGLVRFN
jgi:hypothetical protein